MIQNSDIKNLLIASATIGSQNLVVAEWNMNRYQVINNYGIYTGVYNDVSTAKTSTYVSSDTNIKNGSRYLIYDDNSYKTEEDDQIFSSLASVFEPDRPDPGIVLLTYFSGGLISKQTKNLSVNMINSASPRFYPFSKSRPYTYFNSARYLDPSNKDNVGVSSEVGGGIKNTNIFVVYENTFPCNKITIKMQNHSSVPDIYAIDILDGSNNWTEIFNKNNSNDIVNGILEIYYKKVAGTDTWTTVPARVSDLNELTTPNTQLKTIKGIRFRVGSMSATPDNKNRRRSLELIEISPRIEADITDYTENITINSSISDGEIGLPVGKLVTSNGSLLVSNEDGFFLLSSKAAEYKMLTPEVEFRLYQVVDVAGTTYNVPLKVMYSESWTANDDFTTTISLVDKMSILSEKKAIDMCFISKDGIPMSAIILFLLDNCGITGYEFKKQSNKDDTMIKTFFCKKEETVTEVLQKLAVATQSAMFFDAYNNLNVMTKEKIAQTVSNANSDYWMIMDENYGGYTGSIQFKDYLANVISTNDAKITPMTDGKIEYHAFGINRSAGYSLLQDVQIKDYLQDTPFLLLANSGYGPKFTRVWSADQTKDSVFGTGALIAEVSNSRLKDAFGAETEYTASTQNGAVSLMFNEAKSNAAKRKALLIPIDDNDIYLFDKFDGYVSIDKEIIAYKGKVFSINGQDKILFSKEELTQEVANLSKNNSSIIPKALVVDVIFNVSSINTNGEYVYKIKSDGRKQFGTEIDQHFNDPVDTYVKSASITSFIIGDTSSKKAPNEEFFKDNIQKFYDFSALNNWSKLRSILGYTKDFQPKNYNGLLKLSGPPIPSADRIAATGNKAVENQNKINKEIDASANIGDFAPFVYTNGERNIYIQKINLEDSNGNVFQPNVIATRMKLLSSKESQTLSGPKISAHSAIAGIGFALKEDSGVIKNGYFFEVESIGSAGTKEEGKKDKTARTANIRFYLITEKD